MCFRILDGEKWTTGARAALRALMAMDRPPYADVLLSRLEHAPHVRLCDYCACFLKERAHRSEHGRVLRGRKHGMQLTVEHILSGGTRPGPSRPHLLRCVEQLRREGHPFRAIACGRLGECIDAREATHGEDALAFWLMGGRPSIFDDARLAKRVRRWLSDTPTLQPSWWAELPSACRHCGADALDASASSSLALATSATASSSSYMSVLLWSGAAVSLDTAVDSIEAAEETVDARRFMCPRCRRRSVVSYAYHCALWPRLGLTPMPCRDAYYGHLIVRCGTSASAVPLKKKRPRDEEEEAGPLPPSCLSLKTPVVAQNAAD
jgi:hypothetical protein